MEATPAGATLYCTQHARRLACQAFAPPTPHPLAYFPPARGDSRSKGGTPLGGPINPNRPNNPVTTCVSFYCSEPVRSTRCSSCTNIQTTHYPTTILLYYYTISAPSYSNIQSHLRVFLPLGASEVYRLQKRDYYTFPQPYCSTI